MCARVLGGHVPRFLDEEGWEQGQDSHHRDVSEAPVEAVELHDVPEDRAGE